jgi:hypothetical protein
MRGYCVSPLHLVAIILMSNYYCCCSAVANESSRQALRIDFLTGTADGRDVTAIKSSSYPSLSRIPNSRSNKIRNNTLRRCSCGCRCRSGRCRRSGSGRRCRCRRWRTYGLPIVEGVLLGNAANGYPPVHPCMQVLVGRGAGIVVVARIGRLNAGVRLCGQRANHV